MNDKKNSCSVQSQAPVTRRYGLATPFDDIFSGMFDDFFKITPARRGFEKPLNFQPKLNIQETENDYVVKLEVPGMKESDFDITLSDNVLTLRGHKSQDYDEKEGNMHYVGRSYGSFEQSIPVNVEINEDAVSATADQGILTIKLPKKEPTKDRTRKISVKSL